MSTSMSVTTGGVFLGNIVEAVDAAGDVLAARAAVYADDKDDVDDDAAGVCRRVINKPSSVDSRR